MRGNSRLGASAADGNPGNEPNREPSDNSEVRFSAPLRGYGELHEAYQVTCLDGRRGADGRLWSNPRGWYDKRALDGLLNEFQIEVASWAARHGIPSKGYSVSISDRCMVITRDSFEYFLIAEILDDKLRPAIILKRAVKADRNGAGAQKHKVF